MNEEIQKYSDEIKVLESNIRKLTEPLLEKKKELSDLQWNLVVEGRKAEFEEIKGKVFYGDKSTHNGFDNRLYLMIPKSCNDWSCYNSCNIIKIECIFNDTKTKFTLNYEYSAETRVSNFNNIYKELNVELLNDIKSKINVDISDILSQFNIK